MENIFGDFDFDLLNSPDFKEDSVREELILPILKALGYSATGENKIIRSKKLRHEFVTVGSKEVPLTNFPDYLFEVNGKYTWVLDAKGPNEEIKMGKNREQTYFYAIHPEINVPFFALCNGKEFILHHISQSEAVLFFSLSEIDKHWNELEQVLSAQRFTGHSAPPASRVPQTKNSTIFLANRLLKSRELVSSHRSDTTEFMAISQNRLIR